MQLEVHTKLRCQGELEIRTGSLKNERRECVATDLFLVKQGHRVTKSQGSPGGKGDKNR